VPVILHLLSENYYDYYFGYCIHCCAYRLMFSFICCIFLSFICSFVHLLWYLRTFPYKFTFGLDYKFSWPEKIDKFDLPNNKNIPFYFLIQVECVGCLYDGRIFQCSHPSLSIRFDNVRFMWRQIRRLETISGWRNADVTVGRRYAIIFACTFRNNIFMCFSLSLFIWI